MPVPPYSLFLQIADRACEEWMWWKVENLRIYPAAQRQQGGIMTKMKEKLSP